MYKLSFNLKLKNHIYMKIISYLCFKRDVGVPVDLDCPVHRALTGGPNLTWNKKKMFNRLRPKYMIPFFLPGFFYFFLLVRDVQYICIPLN